MIYKYRVTLPGIKGFFRVYKVHSSNTLYTLSRVLQYDLEFPQDQPILFKAMGEDGGVIARYALVDLGNGAVDDVTIADLIKQGCTSLVYFYDTKSKKNVIITLEDEPEKATGVFKPYIVESKGPNPIEFENGYISFEDLPQDHRKIQPLGSSEDPDGDEDPDDEDNEPTDDDRDPNDEDGQEIYDENE